MRDSSLITKKDFGSALAFIDFLQSDPITEKIRTYLERRMDPAGDDYFVPFDCEPFLKKTSKNVEIYYAIFKQLIHYLLELNLSKQSEPEKLVSCYIFNICHRLCTGFKRADSVSLRTVWEHVFLLNDDNYCDTVSRLKEELKELTGHKINNSPNYT